MELKLQDNKPKRRINISKKEKNLLLILLVAILFWVSNRFVITPQGKTIEKLKEEKTVYENELLKIQETLARENAIKKEWESLNLEFNKASDKYYQKMSQPDLMHMINDIIDSGKLQVPSMSFRDVEAMELEGLQADFLGVSLPFIGTYTDLEVFMYQLRNSPKKLLIEQLSISKDISGDLNGQLSLNAYAYGGANAMGSGYFYNNAYESQSKSNPFAAFEGYVDAPVYSEYSSDGEIKEKRALLADLENDQIYYMGTDSGVTGKISRFSWAKFGKTSIRAEYYISTGYKPERVYVVLDDQNINIKYPPPSIGVWSYSYGYSPVTVGLRFQDMDGRKIDLELEKGVNWTGWKYISASPPQDINVYPLKLDRIYMELGPNRDDYGVLLFDRIEASYPSEEDKKEELPSYVFYVVKPGDTLMSISEDFYGSMSQHKKIMKDNGLVENSVLEVGKILVIQK